MSTKPKRLKPGFNSSMDLSLSLEERVNLMVKGYVEDADYDFFDASLFRSNLQLVSVTASPPRTVFRLTVPRGLCTNFDLSQNRMNNLHGAAASLMMDTLTTTAIMPISKKGFWEYVGVSRTLNVTFLRPVPEDTEIEVTSEVLQIGKRMCTIRGELRRVIDGALCVVGEHGKANTDPVLEKL